MPVLFLLFGLAFLLAARFISEAADRLVTRELAALDVYLPTLRATK